MFNPFKKAHNFWPATIWQDWFMLSGSLVAFVVLAMSTVTKFSIWFDEAFGSYLVRFNIWDLTRYTASDVHPPFYYWLLKIWTMMFGNTELGIRSMSIFFGALTIILAFLLVLRLFGRRAAYVSLIFLMLSPIFIRYSQEARMYTVLTTIVLAATYVLVYAQEHSKKRWPWIIYGVLVALGMLTQYFAALAWLAHWAWRILTIRSEGNSWKKTTKKLFSKQWVIAHVIAIGLFLPWLPWMVIQFALVQGNGFWILPVTAATIPDFISTFLLFKSQAAAESWLALAFYIVVAVVAYLVFKLLRTLKGEHKNNYLLLVCMVVVPVVLLFILSLPPLRPAFVDRYLMTTIVFLAILTAVTLVLSHSMLRLRLRIGIGLIIVVMMCVGIYNQSVIGNYNKSSLQSNNVRQLIEAVRAKSTMNTPIIGNTPWIFYEAAIYERSDSPIYFVDESTEYKFGSLTMLVENDDHKIKDVDEFDKQHKSFWVIANLNDGAPNVLRSSWHEQESITINDDVSHAPLFKAVRYTTN
jgi:mannosyltransferase